MQYPWIVYALTSRSCVRVTTKLHKEDAVIEANDYNYFIGLTPHLAVQHTAIAVPLPWTGE